jgi:hypothetical protein
LLLLLLLLWLLPWLLLWLQPWLQQAAAAVFGHHEECNEGQAMNSACHLVESLVGALASRQSEDTHMLAV